jgi:hypothetical protein
MATTTNYSWSTPDDTALVKDGAAAIRSLGTAIDTTVFTNAGAAIAKTIVDAKGDLIVGTAADTVARLAVGGTNGHSLQIDSSTATGLAWAAPATGGGMTLLSTTALSGTSTTVSTINQTYNHLYIVVYNVTTASNVSYKWQTNITSSVYSQVQMSSGATNGGPRLGTSVGLDDMVESVLSTGGLNTYTLLLQNYASTAIRKTFSSEFGYEGQHTGGRYVSIDGIISSLTAVDSFTFTNSGPATQNSGTMLIYGVK